MTVVYSLGHEFVKALEMTPEKVIRKLRNVRELSAPHVSKPRVEIRCQQHASRSQEKLDHVGCVVFVLSRLPSGDAGVLFSSASSA